MNVQRAKQILESPKEIEVHYQGVPVWIQNVDETGHTARVYTANEPDDEKVIPVDQLNEL
jgi:small acid-soluble spore protein H (minor)